jgi:hypothetical protein
VKHPRIPRAAWEEDRASCKCPNKQHARVRVPRVRCVQSAEASMPLRALEAVGLGWLAMAPAPTVPRAARRTRRRTDPTDRAVQLAGHRETASSRSNYQAVTNSRASFEGAKGLPLQVGFTAPYAGRKVTSRVTRKRDRRAGDCGVGAITIRSERSA